jgi:hypothetical protein
MMSQVCLGGFRGNGAETLVAYRIVSAVRIVPMRKHGWHGMHVIHGETPVTLPAVMVREMHGPDRLGMPSERLGRGLLA